MPFVKIVKNKAYFKRYQVQYRRRREGKTDYRARRQMVLQDKTKYGAPKYRLVVRITNTDVIAQIVHAKVEGDDVFMAAYSHELKSKYNQLQVGLKNYAAAYCTGLLVARRTLTKLGMTDDKFAGQKDANGNYQPVRTKKDDEEGEGRFPFKAILDVGLARTTTGSRVFGVLKGAVDGGLAVPHRPNRFPGFDKAGDKLNAKVHRDHIFGKHVGDWLKAFKEEHGDSPNAQEMPQFAQYIKNKIQPADVETMYKKMHAAIRADPKMPQGQKGKAKVAHKQFHAKKQTHAVRKAAAKAKVAALRSALGI